MVERMVEPDFALEKRMNKLLTRSGLTCLVSLRLPSQGEVWVVAELVCSWTSGEGVNRE